MFKIVDESLTKTSLYINKKVLKTLKRIAVEKDTNQSELMRKYIDIGIEKDKTYLNK